MVQLGVCCQTWRHEEDFGFRGRRLTSVLRLDGDDPLPLGAEAPRGLSLHFKLVGNVLGQVWDGQAGLGAVAAHLEGARVSWNRGGVEVRNAGRETQERCCIRCAAPHLRRAAARR